MEKGASPWLSALPIKAIGYALNKQEFTDAISVLFFNFFSVLGLRFSWGCVKVGVFSRFYGLLYPALDAHRMGPH